MGTVTNSLDEAAESIFNELGYVVREGGDGIRAERKWRVVDVMTMTEPTNIPASGEFRCFVTWADNVEALESDIERQNPSYEWAIIGITGEDDYVVSRR